MIVVAVTKRQKGDLVARKNKIMSAIFCEGSEIMESAVCLSRHPPYLPLRGATMVIIIGYDVGVATISRCK